MATFWATLWKIGLFYSNIWSHWQSPSFVSCIILLCRAMLSNKCEHSSKPFYVEQCWAKNIFMLSNVEQKTFYVGQCWAQSLLYWARDPFKSWLRNKKVLIALTTKFNNFGGSVVTKIDACEDYNTSELL